MHVLRMVALAVNEEFLALMGTMAADHNGAQVRQRAISSTSTLFNFNSIISTSTLSLFNFKSTSTSLLQHWSLTSTFLTFFNFNINPTTSTRTPAQSRRWPGCGKSSRRRTATAFCPTRSRYHDTAIALFADVSFNFNLVYFTFFNFNSIQLRINQIECHSFNFPPLSSTLTNIIQLQYNQPN